MSPEPAPSQKAGNSDASAPTIEIPGATPGAEIGPYKIVRPLGEGGMGVVYHAYQTHPIHRDVALKIIKPGMDTRQVIARFESERQALALMDHPNIARVFDAGSTAAGLPYFAMELVNGVPITTYCDDHRLTVRERIELFIPVCRASQHAHQKGIIHRDLKPSNILVTELEGKPVPKVIDFGLAKALGPQMDSATLLTNLGVVIGTLDYMSPEQADFARQDVDTRSDVYSLGAVLYKLLTGTTPLDSERLLTEGYMEALRRIREGETPTPSSRIRDLASSADIAAHRKSDAAQLPKLLHGELDWISMKALEKDRARRYETANAMARDLERYMAGEPVEAAPPSTYYRMQKFVRKHVWALSFAGTVFALLVAFAVAVTVQDLRITRERDRADRITHFVVGLFRVTDPYRARGTNISAREILDKGAQEIESGLKTDPLVKADLLNAMADSYDGLGLYPRALKLTQEALEIQRRVLGAKDRKTLHSMSLAGSRMLSSGQTKQAADWLRNTLANAERALGPSDPYTLQTRRYLSQALWASADFQSAERFARGTLALDRRVLGADNPETLQTMSDLAIALEDQGHPAEAEKLDREALEAERRTLGGEDPITLETTVALAKVLVEEGNYPDAEALLNQALPLDRRILGDEHETTLATLGELAHLSLKEGKYAEAEKLFAELVATRQRLYGPDSAINLGDMEELAITYAREGRYPDASQLFHRALGIAQKHNDPTLMVGWYNFACAAAIAGRRDEAFQYLREAVERGFDYPDQIAGDNDLASLRADPRFAAILDEARQRASQKK